MKTIKLMNLKLTNFKGIKNFEFKTDGQDANVFGENGTGKTTLFDAFVWLLFGKDSNNSSKFEIKTLKDGKVLHHLDHEVEGALLVDSKEMTLKKVYKEKWTKQRGSITETFSGHTTRYFIDDVPVKKKEYDDMITNLVDEDVFKLLTNPSFFNKQLGWEKRRETLIEVAGNVTDDDVIATNKELEKLKEVLSNRTIEDHKKVIVAKRKEINEELERIPVRIDEINRNLPDVGELNRNELGSKMDAAQADIDAKQEQINNIKNGSETNAIKLKISEIDLEISKVKGQHEQEQQEELSKLEVKHQEEQSNLLLLRNELKGLEQQKQSNQTRVKDIEQQMNDLRTDFKEQNRKEFEHGTECSCPTCGQDLPTEQVEEAKANFNRNKADKLEKINQQGVELGEKVKGLQEENEYLQKNIDKITEQGVKKSKDIKRLEEKITKAKEEVKPVEENETYTKLVNDKKSLEQKIERLEQSIGESVQKVMKELEAFRKRQNSLQMDLSTIQQAETSKERINELEAQEKKLACEFEELEHDLYLIEEFTRAKVNMLEEKINSKFKFATFKLFEEQINGGLKETCETLYKGVPYSSGLNNAAQINVGLDIINTLSTHYGVQAPIFVDNAESVNRLLDIDSQVISLVVSDNKQLKIENKSEKEVA